MECISRENDLKVENTKISPKLILRGVQNLPSIIAPIRWNIT
jgi:hypothetical protein